MTFVRICALLALVASGCRPQSSGDAPTPDAASGPAFPQTVTDTMGFRITLPAKPLRIVSTAPSNTEVLFAIGAGDQVVGVTTYCNFPPEAARRTKVGGFSPKTISAETILELNPDLVLTTGRLQQTLTDPLRKLNLSVLSFDAQTLEDVAHNIREFGVVTGHWPEADTLADRLEARLNTLQKWCEAITVDRRPRVLLLVGEEPLMTAGPKTFPGQLLERAGGRNLFADADQQFPKISEEEIVRRNPDAVLIWQMGDPTERINRIAKRGAWKDLTAVRENRILHIDDDIISRAGPRLFDGLEQLAELLHPSKKK
ncbi:ABC transporter substrate-binding protein [Limnoglobus roseus]|uniref:Cobalamin-binding protein n=1 Tax=Limnoglobus roseus TaxID=2598579 RepID=A0A5C1AJR1_9BACT|nr:cobalamin-binding protein [Limnoglobus roseus]QEL18246.1 cobalamin-binding protein [Limnoglobus roseus]